LGFDGEIVSDALNMAGFTGWAAYESRILDCFNSGVDMMLWPGTAYFELMEHGIASGAVCEKRLNDSVFRILKLKTLMGLMFTEEGGATVRTAESEAELRRQAKRTAIEISKRGITLVRNRRGLIPLGNDIKKVLVVKPSVGEHGRYREVDPLAELLRDRGINVTVLENFESAASRTRIRQLEEQGERWDAVLVVTAVQGYDPLMTALAGDAPNGVWATQTAETIHPIFISVASPYLLHSLPYIDTLINCYGGGRDTYDVLVQGLFGEFEMTARSPIDPGGWPEHI
jgi:beta-N-acetylhexosaminidase